MDGTADGTQVGTHEGNSLGALLGIHDGVKEGIEDGILLGTPDGVDVGIVVRLLGCRRVWMTSICIPYDAPEQLVLIKNLKPHVESISSMGGHS